MINILYSNLPSYDKVESALPVLKNLGAAAGLLAVGALTSLIVEKVFKKIKGEDLTNSQMVAMTVTQIAASLVATFAIAHLLSLSFGIIIVSGIALAGVKLTHLKKADEAYEFKLVNPKNEQPPIPKDPEEKSWEFYLGKK